MHAVNQKLLLLNVSCTVILSFRVTRNCKSWTPPQPARRPQQTSCQINIAVPISFTKKYIICSQRWNIVNLPSLWNGRGTNTWNLPCHRGHRRRYRGICSRRGHRGFRHPLPWRKTQRQTTSIAWWLVAWRQHAVAV